MYNVVGSEVYLHHYIAASRDRQKEVYVLYRDIVA
jgi:hypothetical protein